MGTPAVFSMFVEAPRSCSLLLSFFLRNTEITNDCNDRAKKKVFNNNSRILAIKPSGNVFAAEAVEELNYKAKSWNDLLTGEEFTKRVRNVSRVGRGGGAVAAVGGNAAKIKTPFGTGRFCVGVLPCRSPPVG